MQARRMRLLYRARKLPRGFFGYRVADVLEVLETLEAQEHTDREWVAKDAAGLESALARVRERIHGMESEIRRVRQESELLDRQVGHRRENLEILKNGVQIEAKRLEEEHAHRVTAIQQLFWPVDASIADADQALGRLVDSLTNALTIGKPTRAPEPQHFQDVTALLFGSVDPPESIVGSWLDDGRVRLGAVPSQVAVTTRAGRILGHLSALLVEGFPLRVVGYEIRAGAHEVLVVAAADILAVHPERIIVQEGVGSVDSERTLDKDEAVPEPLRAVVPDGSVPGLPVFLNDGREAKDANASTPPPAIGVSLEHTTSAGRDSGLPGLVVSEPREPRKTIEGFQNFNENADRADPSAPRSVANPNAAEEVPPDTSSEDHSRREDPAESLHDLGNDDRHAGDGHEHAQDDREVTLGGDEESLVVPPAWGLSSLPTAGLDADEDIDRELSSDVWEHDSSEEYPLPGLDGALGGRAPAAVGVLPGLTQASPMSAAPGGAGSTSDTTVDTSPRTPASGTERALPADPAPTSPHPGDQADVGDGGVETVATDVLVFLVGKIVGQDILDAGGSMLAQAGTPIDEGLVRRVEAAGRLSELIVHMTLARS